MYTVYVYTTRYVVLKIYHSALMSNKYTDVIFLWINDKTVPLQM